MSKQDIDHLARTFLSEGSGPAAGVFTMNHRGQILYIASEPGGASMSKHDSLGWNEALRLKGEGLLSTSGGQKRLRIRVTRSGRAVVNRMRELMGWSR